MDWASSMEEDHLESSPALRNLFAKVVEAVGSAVAGLHNLSRLVFVPCQSLLEGLELRS